MYSKSHEFRKKNKTSYNLERKEYYILVWGVGVGVGVVNDEILNWGKIVLLLFWFEK